MHRSDGADDCKRIKWRWSDGMGYWHPQMSLRRVAILYEFVSSDSSPVKWVHVAGEKSYLSRTLVVEIKTIIFLAPLGEPCFLICYVMCRQLGVGASPQLGPVGNEALHGCQLPEMRRRIETGGWCVSDRRYKPEARVKCRVFLGGVSLQGHKVGKYELRWSNVCTWVLEAS